MLAWVLVHFFSRPAHPFRLLSRFGLHTSSARSHSTRHEARKAAPINAARRRWNVANRSVRRFLVADGVVDQGR